MIDKVLFLMLVTFCNLPGIIQLQQITFFPPMQFRKREILFCQVTPAIKKDQQKSKKKTFGQKKVVLPMNNNNKSQCTFYFRSEYMFL